ncbi:MAG TPA: DUF1540 domain-containing protein [Chloroflexota bacterium]|nr:DUF1540 domain-containing protein [Chloroflexota bacterium]
MSGTTAEPRPEGTRPAAGGRGVILRCTAVDCAYNEKFRCVAENVVIVRHQDHADCATYTENQHRVYRVAM